MAKTDAFFIRAKVDSNGATYAEAEIDMGSFVNLGVSKSTLARIMSVSAQITDLSDASLPILDAADAKISWQLTTQSQSAIVTADDKSLVSSGSLVIKTGVSPSHDYDVNPQMWAKGYLTAVDTLFIGVDMNTALDSGNVTVALVLETLLENATQASSVALALSQQ